MYSLPGKLEGSKRTYFARTSKVTIAQLIVHKQLLFIKANKNCNFTSSSPGYPPQSNLSVSFKVYLYCISLSTYNSSTLTHEIGK